MTLPNECNSRGRFLAPPAALVFVVAGDPPDAGYAIRLGDGRLYRNGEIQGWVLSLKYNSDARGVWVEYEAIAGTMLARFGDDGLAR